MLFYLLLAQIIRRIWEKHPENVCYAAKHETSDFTAAVRLQEGLDKCLGQALQLAPQLFRVDILHTLILPKILATNLAQEETILTVCIHSSHWLQ